MVVGNEIFNKIHLTTKQNRGIIFLIQMLLEFLLIYGLYAQADNQ